MVISYLAKMEVTSQNDRQDRSYLRPYYQPEIKQGKDGSDRPTNSQLSILLKV